MAEEGGHSHSLITVKASGSPGNSKPTHTHMAHTPPSRYY